MRRCLVIFLTLILLWMLVAQANHLLAPWHVYLFAGGLFITYPALAMPSRAGLAATLLAGLAMDAATPVPFGLHATLLATAHLLIFNIRDRVPRDDTITRVVVALLANLGVFLAFSFLEVTRNRAPGTAWPRLVFDLLCSQAGIALIGPWFFALQAKSDAWVRPGRALAQDYE